MHTFISWKDTATDYKRSMLVIRAGPFNILVLDMLSDDGNEFYLAQGKDTFPRPEMATDMENILVASATPMHRTTEASNGIAWKMGEWLPLKQWIADFNMCTIKAGMLIKVCSKLKVPGHSKLDHRHRVELYLRFMEKDEEFINAVLAALPVRQRKKKTQKDHQLTKHVLPKLFSIVYSFKGSMYTHTPAKSWIIHYTDVHLQW